MYGKTCMIFGACLLALTFLGCGSGGPEIAGVEGTVTMDGKPLAQCFGGFCSRERSAGGSQNR